jgi:hypothetical protein
LAGTKMTLRRYGNEMLYWNEQEILVDQAYLDSGYGLFVHLTHPYVMDTKQLDVYFNGQHLLVGGGYEEINEYTIRLDLGVYPPEHPMAGQVIPLVIGDEIYIRTWKPEYRDTGGIIDPIRFVSLEEEIIKARRYKDADLSFPKLDDRLDHIQQKAETKTIIFVFNRLNTGVAPFVIPFPHDGRITEVYASCVSEGSERTVFQIEKCSQDDYDNAPIWTNIFKDNLCIDGGERTSKTSSRAYTISNPILKSGDHLRVNVIELGTGFQNVTIGVIVSI